MTQAQIKSFISTVAKRASLERALVKQDFRQADGATKEKFTLKCVNTQLDRQIIFVPVVLDNLDKLAMFRPETYSPIFDKMHTLDLMDCGGIEWNTLLAIYDSANDVTWFGFNPAIDVIAVEVDDKIGVSPYLPY